MKKLAPVLSFLVAISTLQVFSYNYAFKNTTTTDLTVSIDIGLRFPVSFYILINHSKINSFEKNLF